MVSAFRMGPPMLLAALTGCGINPALRAERDQTIGVLETAGYALHATDGLLHVVGSTDSSVLLRASCLEIELTLERRAAAQVELQITNIPPGFALVGPPGVLTADGSAKVGTEVADMPLTARWTVTWGGRESVVLRTPDSAARDFTFLAFGDIQNGIVRFDDVIDKVNAERDADFILMLGDLTDRSTVSEYDAVDRAYAKIRFPILATPGNHDVFVDQEYQRRFGRVSYSCPHKGARFTSIDSSAAYLAPQTFDAYAQWLEQGKEQTHVVFSHIPATDFSGLRAGQWNSRREAHRFLAASNAGNVDLLLFGHIHSYDSYSLAGIRTYISGGCGAYEEELDGIGRHYLKVKVSPGAVPSVEVVRVDP
ncbi:MAG: metallophosphoesterase [Myxococcaceae bacterium]|nr:metallophosphoesterase [Myxococcaceae bacterium]